MNQIPFFYYDFRARMVPGAAVLAIFGVLGYRLPLPYSTWFVGPETWKAVVVPLLLAGAAYVIGDTMEAVFRWLWKWIDRYVFPQVLARHHRRYPSTFPDLKSAEDQVAYRHDVWEWLALNKSKDYPGAFSHAHRFQSEARMFLNLSIPVATLFGYYVFQHHGHMCLRSTLFALACGGSLVRLSVACEKRRWLQVLDAARQLDFRWSGR